MEEVKPAATGSENATQEQGYLMAYDKKEQKAKGVKGGKRRAGDARGQ